MSIVIFRDSEISKSIEKLIKKLDQKTKALWAASCSEHVLNFKNNVNPDEKRPLMAIKAARDWGMDKIPAAEAKEAELKSNAASKEVDTLPAMMMAKAAEHAAAISHSKGRTTFTSATFAAKVVFHDAEEEDKDKALEEEREWQFNLLVEMSG